jgi:hypothetical protein
LVDAKKALRERAIQHIEAALSLAPEDSRVWTRLLAADYMRRIAFSRLGAR